MRAFPTTRRSSIVTFGTDAQGGAYADERVLADLHAHGECSFVRRAERVCSATGVVGGRHDVH